MISILIAVSTQYSRRKKSHDKTMSVQAWKDNCQCLLQLGGAGSLYHNFLYWALVLKGHSLKKTLS